MPPLRLHPWSLDLRMLYMSHGQVADTVRSEQKMLALDRECESWEIQEIAGNCRKLREIAGNSIKKTMAITFFLKMRRIAL